MNDQGLGLFNSGAFTLMAKIADSLADSSLLPEHLRLAKNGESLPREVRVANCMLVVNAARLWEVDPFQLAAHSYVVGGKLDFDGKVYAALVNTHGGLAEHLNVSFEGTGEERRAVIIGRLSHETEPRTVEIHFLEARTMDRHQNVTAQWKRDVDQMLFYAGARKWVRRHCPQVLLGLVETTAATTEDTCEYEATALPAPMPSTQAKIAEQAPSENYTKTLMALRACKDLAALAATVDTLKGQRNLSMKESERAALNEEVARLKSELPPGESESFRRWERTVKTSVDREEAIQAAAEIDDDGNLSADEKKTLGGIVTAVLAGMPE